MQIRKSILGVAIALAFMGMVGLSQASLVTIGTAEYDGNVYKLIYDDDDTGHDGGGLVWLDYSRAGRFTLWVTQKAWAETVGSDLTVTLFPGYTTDIDWTTGWRLPDTVDGSYVSGYEGDPDNDGFYSYTWGYNLANSEMGHLFYAELGNAGYRNTDGTWNVPLPPAPDYFLQNKGEFENLYADVYYSGTLVASHSGYAWSFMMTYGSQGEYSTGSLHDAYAMAVHPGQVSTVPLPQAVLMLGSGLLGLVAIRRRKKAA